MGYCGNCVYLAQEVQGGNVVELYCRNENSPNYICPIKNIYVYSCSEYVCREEAYWWRHHCRTADEDKIHEKAVKIRKMTDEQLMQYVNDRVEKARSEGFNQGRKSAAGMTVNEFLKEISNIWGVGSATVGKIRDHFRKVGKADE